MKKILGISMVGAIASIVLIFFSLFTAHRYQDHSIMLAGMARSESDAASRFELHQSAHQLEQQSKAELRFAWTCGFFGVLFGTLVQQAREQTKLSNGSIV